MTEGKTNIRLEVKWSDCAPGEIPELPANTGLKINAERCCRAAEQRSGLLAAPLLFFFQGHHDLAPNLRVFQPKSEQSTLKNEAENGSAGTQASVSAV